MGNSEYVFEFQLHEGISLLSTAFQMMCFCFNPLFRRLPSTTSWVSLVLEDNLWHASSIEEQPLEMSAMGAHFHGRKNE
eukprot:1194184-Amphidinium_carterae.1